MKIILDSIWLFFDKRPIFIFIHSFNIAQRCGFGNITRKKWKFDFVKLDIISEKGTIFLNI